MKLGLHNAARYYYYPGWHEPGTTAEFGFNKKAYDSLPADLKARRRPRLPGGAGHLVQEYEYKNTIALQKLKTEFKGKVELVKLSDATLKDLKKLAEQVIKEESEKTPDGQEGHTPRSTSSRPRPTTGD